VLREPQVIDAEVTDPTMFNIRIDLEFDEPMDVGLTPGDTKVELVTDGGNWWMPFDSWTDATHARYSQTIPWPPAWGTVQLKVSDPNLKDLDGNICLTSEAISVHP
jgi:hypothetical protein